MDRWSFAALVSVTVMLLLYLSQPAWYREPIIEDIIASDAAPPEKYYLTVTPVKTSYAVGERVQLVAQLSVAIHQRSVLYQPLHLVVTAPSSASESVALTPAENIACDIREDVCVNTFVGSYVDTYEEGLYAVAGAINGLTAAKRFEVYNTAVLGAHIIDHAIGPHVFDDASRELQDNATVYRASYTSNGIRRTVVVYEFPAPESAAAKLAAITALSSGNVVKETTAGPVLAQEACCVWWTAKNYAIMISGSFTDGMFEPPLEILAAYKQTYPDAAAQ